MDGPRCTWPFLAGNGQLLICSLSGFLLSSLQLAHDHLVKLPNEVVTKILLYLFPKEIAGLCQVNKRWRVLGADNFIWWKFCMEVFWEPSLRPSRMTKNDKKQSWKTHYMNVCVKNIDPIPEPERLVKQWLDPPPLTKEELREQYKSGRAKPKGKRPVHFAREFFDI